MLKEPLLALHLFLIFDLSSLHPSPPVLYFSPCLCIYHICAPSLSVPVFLTLPSCHPVQHLSLPLTFPGSRQQCLSLLQFGVAAAQEADLTQPLCPIHQLACRAGMPTDTTHSVSHQHLQEAAAQTEQMQQNTRIRKHLTILTGL